MKTKLSLAVGLLLLAGPAFAQHLPKSPVFKITPLVSNQKGKAPVVDPNLVDAWGLSQGSGSAPVWVSDNGTGLSTVYAQGNGQNEGLVVTIPKGFPTGTVFVPSNTGFPITENGKTANAVFLFDSESGVISGWNQSVDASNAVVAIDNSANGAVYKGLALDASSKLLFAANFSQNKVEIYDNAFDLMGTFTDTNLPARYAPFNVAIFNGDVYVTFAERKKNNHDEVDGPGLGYVDVFTESGTLVTQLVAAGGPLNAPWGMTIAPSNFGTFANDLLVGNFGDGWINAFDPSTGAYVGPLSTKKGPIAIDGLWALDPVPTGDITFSAGPNKEKNGLLGLITTK